MTSVGFLHPGAMGARVAESCAAHALWCTEGRSAETTARAAAAGIEGVGSLPELIERSDIVVSVCPPGAAVETAVSVAATGFDGIYVDANAVAPATARTIASNFATFVDGGIIGPPPENPATTRMYLSGSAAVEVAGLWDGSVLDARVIGGGPGAASALKMAYATWTKASAAMLLAVRSLARAEGVDVELLAEWAISQPGAEARSEAAARATAPKAWRFDGEMAEIAETFGAVGLPDGFALAARHVFGRMADLKGVDDATIDDVVARLLSSD